MIAAVLKSDPWLSNQLAVPAFSVAGDTPCNALAAVLPTEKAFVWTKINTDAPEQLMALQEIGFRVIDMHLTFSGIWTDTSQPRSDDILVRTAQKQDRDPVCEIARSVFSHDRFHADPFIADTVADRIKAEWAGNYFTGQRGDTMLVAVTDSGMVAGFLQLFLPEIGIVMLDLIGVSPAHQGKGIATALFTEAWNRYALLSPDTGRMIFGTQASNIPSCRLYETRGLRLTTSKWVLHYHSKSRIELGGLKA